ncbi:flagellar hook-associated protein 2 [Aquibacillus halophilus]|uniref:Flagellar hook-associated protein 2 n=1 Tax=Aquibacillus halophilus TaxID=930132 RepID=A0A6A8D8Q7_9BACI|nr:flagellar hook-associated protein 2 [Aquibacillus halophilus]MRH41978.1 flagellar hook-associated protein 2 [Aquibacillus halophilus]
MAYSVNTSNRISGLASGMDTDTMVKQLMAAERMPLDKLEQDKTWTTWQRDSFRDVNKLLYDLDSKILDMKMQRTYSSKTTNSSSNSVSATATANASNGSYSVQVNQLASSAINVGSDLGLTADGKKIDPAKSLSSQFSNVTVPSSFEFSVYNEDGKSDPFTINIVQGDTLNSVLKKITNSGADVRAFYDSTANKVVMERTKTGNFNTSAATDTTADSGHEIIFGTGFLTDTLKLTQNEEKDGKNADFLYNGKLTVTPTTNSYTINDITFNFNELGTSTVTVRNDIDASYDKIMAFVDQYNETLEKVNGYLNEERFRTYKPLTDEQKKELSEDEIERWEEKAKSGTLKGESILSSGLSSMRQNWYGEVDNTSSFTHLTHIGIKTSSNYMERGKLEVDPDKLKKALREDPQSVHQLFSNDVKGSGRGIINRLEDSIESTMKNIESRAGKTSSVQNQYTLGRNLDNLDDRISAFEDRLVRIENRYWRQFTEMEKAIQQMNNQSNYLMQQFSY